MRARYRKSSRHHNVWRSYSDLMAGLLLLFVLVMCVSFMQAQRNYQDRVNSEAQYQLTESQLQAQLEEQQSELDEQAALLAQQQADLDEQSALVASQQASLEEQSALVASQQASLEEQSALLAQQESELDEQSALVASQQASLEEQEELMAIQQERIEQIVGVKADLISALKSEFDKQNLAVSIDETDGSIVFDSNVLFGYNENTLTEAGRELLGEMLPVYCSVLTSEEYIDYLAEIRIDGYTDTSGTYEYNLQLSQERSSAVAEYLLSLSGESIPESEIGDIQELLSANGHSWSNPIYTEEGEVDAEASRRVEIKFRLKDEEMINELKDILEDSPVQ